MKKILLVGNGFDLAHGLLTNYQDFLKIMQHWKEFRAEYDRKEKCKRENVIEGFTQQDIFEALKIQGDVGLYIDKYVYDIAEIDATVLDELEKIIKSNSWVKYFCNCGAEIDGWIDFEKEIYPVIEMFNFIFKADYFDAESYNSEMIYIKKQDITTRNLKLFKCWNKYINVGSEIWITKEYGGLKGGLLKKRILKSLKNEFDEFIYAFELYLHEFVYKNKSLKLLKQVKEIETDYVISFNYTLTESMYGVSEEKVHHIHGKIRPDLKVGKNNMILGVNESYVKNNEFIYFVKYFQRIQKRIGTTYKGFLEECGYKGKKWICNNKAGYELHIYGHSLDVTDRDILEYVIEGAQKVKIYYYNQDDYERKVINLITIYGREAVETNIESGYFEFLETNDEKIVINKVDHV